MSVREDRDFKPGDKPVSVSCDECGDPLTLGDACYCEKCREYEIVDVDGPAALVRSWAIRQRTLGNLSAREFDLLEELASDLDPVRDSIHVHEFKAQMGRTR